MVMPKIEEGSSALRNWEHFDQRVWMPEEEMEREPQSCLRNLDATNQKM